MGLLKKIAAWFKGLFRSGKRLFAVTWKEAGAAALDKLNDEDLQAAALECVKAAAGKALGGDEAWDDAYAALKARALGLGKDWGRAVLETVLQNVYLAWKEEGKN